MDALFTGKMGARHLSQIKEESDSREHSGCFLPPIALQQYLPGRAGDPGVDEAQRQEARHLTPLALFEEQQTLEGHRTLLEELSLIEANLRASLHLDFERLQEAEFLRQQENKQLRQDLCFLSLSQRVAKYIHAKTPTLKVSTLGQQLLQGISHAHLLSTHPGCQL